VLDHLPDPGAAVGRVVAVAVLDLLGLDRQRLVLLRWLRDPRATFGVSISYGNSREGPPWASRQPFLI
jgi:hypothetical protein